MGKKNEYEQSFALNSAFKTNYNDTTSSFTYVFPEKLTNVIDIRISHLEIPVDVYFTVSQYYGNNNFKVTIEGTTHTITLPDSNYITMDDYRDIINHQLANAFVWDTAIPKLIALHNDYTLFFHDNRPSEDQNDKIIIEKKVNIVPATVIIGPILFGLKIF